MLITSFTYQIRTVEKETIFLTGAYEFTMTQFTPIELTNRPIRWSLLGFFVLLFLFSSVTIREAQAKRTVSFAKKPISKKRICLDYMKPILMKVDAISKKIEHDPSNENLYLQRGELLLSTQQIERAIADYDKCISLNSEFPLAYFYRARAKEMLAQKLANLSITNATVVEINNRAIKSGLNNEWKKAIELHRMACIREPQNKILLENLCFAHIAYGTQLCGTLRYVTGAEQFALALEADCNSQAAREKLLELKRNYIIDCPSVAHGYPFDAVSKERASASEQTVLHYDQQALQDYSKCLELAPRAVNVLYERAQLRIKLSDPLGAVSDLTATIDLLPGTDHTLLLERARLQLSLEHYGEARSDFSSVLKAQSELSANEKFEAYEGRASAEIAEKRWGAALSDLNIVIADAGERKELLEMRAIVFKHLGRSVQARQDQKKATKKCYIPFLIGASTRMIPNDLGVQESK